jgi:hypothetical protein
MFLLHVYVDLIVMFHSAGFIFGFTQLNSAVVTIYLTASLSVEFVPIYRGT